MHDNEEIDTNTIASPSSPANTKNKDNNNQTRRVLLVDDEADVLTTLKIGLENNGFLVDAFTNPVEALSSFRPGLYDFLLLDVKMPTMNGFQLYREIEKKMMIQDKVKVCFITAYEVYYESLKKEFPGLDVGCFIKKPIVIQDLVKTMRLQLQ
jgi:two-component system, OmpR family, response regulator ChvI